MDFKENKMGFQKVPFGKLKVQNAKQIELLLLDHGFTSILDLSAERRFSVEMLIKTAEVLGEPKKNVRDIPADQRDTLLNAITFHIRDEIQLSYKQTGPNNSVLYLGLGKALGLIDIHKGLIENNQPDLADKKHMLSALYVFFSQKIYCEGDPCKGYLPLADQPFASVVGFKAEKCMDNLSKKVFALDNAAIHECETKEKERLSNLKGDEKKGGISSYIPSMSGMFGSSKSVPSGKEPANSYGM
jgi:hypothetical protein